MGFLQQASSPEVLRKAWESVAAKRGMPGIDRVSIPDFGADLERNLAQLEEEIRSLAYRPQPVMRIRPPFLAASDRALVVPTVRDRVVQRAIADLLTPRIEPELSPVCRAFRKGFSALAAAADVGRWVESGDPWVLRTDVRSFFDSIRPELLRAQLEPFVDEEGLRFLDRIVRCRIFDHHQVSEMVVGIAQGSPLSPLLANLYLAEVDRELNKSHPRTVRYCDDVLVLGPGEEEVRAARDELVALLDPLGLELNEEKTRVCRAEDGFVFLGYHFGAAGRGPAVKAVEALGYRLEELGTAPELDAAELDAVYRGWTGYFGEHPEIWRRSPAGILALLRAAPESLPVAELIAERWRRPWQGSAALALELARAWRGAGRREQSWLELALGCGGSRASAAALEPWARLLGVDATVLEELAGLLVGPPADRAGLLAERLAELGEYEVASRLAAQVPHFSEAVAEGGGPDSGAEEVAEADLRLLVEWFAGREGVHAQESVNRGGHRTFIPVHRPIAEDDWRAHLRGEKTLALPLVRAGDTALLGVLDVDVTKRALHDHLTPEDLLGRALGTARRLRRELEGRGAASLLEASGYKGYHVWVRLAEPAPCFELRRWLLEVVRAVGPLPEGIRVEELPNRDRVRPDAVRPLIKLPLGVHGKTGRRCYLLDDRGEPLDDPFAAIRELPRLPAEVVCRRELPSAEAPAAGEAVPAELEVGPRARRILEGCGVLGELAKRARETSYLDHRERYTLLCVLGHLGEEGAAALHAVIGQTYNYRREVTQRHVDRLPDCPMSCPKIRELHPRAAAAGGCTCRFQLRGVGYPTPLLFALRPGEVPAFQKRAQATAGAAGGEPGARRPEPRQKTAPSPGSPPAAARAEELIGKIGELHRHRRGVEASLRRRKEELAAVFDEAEAELLELPTGNLRRVRRDGGDGWDFVIEV